ncbi:OmpA family protein [Salinibacterium sp. ZJ454]|uniref:OmpA/MotB family protein n=1 Tax=Salinibacterium sp. ZJ454 TaxID=2708339 RepID=UPI001420E971|nr:OmpA family protein [Salinibacterium sp. ZJ454]
MSALLLVFILAVVVLVMQLMQKQSELTGQQDELQLTQARFAAQVGTLQEAEHVRSEILKEIAAGLRAQDIEVSISQDSTVLSIPSSALGFESGSFTINPGYHGVAVTVGSVITEVIAKDDRWQYLDTVFVEGHTDNEPFSGLAETGNWGLSTFRAISLWDLWGEQLPNLAGYRNSEGSFLFSVSGYGETRPASQQQISDEERASNRRIDIRFTVEGPSADDLLEIQRQFEGASEGATETGSP